MCCSACVVQIQTKPSVIYSLVWPMTTSFSISLLLFSAVMNICSAADSAPHVTTVTLHVQYVLMYVLNMESSELYMTADTSRTVREGYLETCRRASLHFIFGYCPLVSSMNTAQTPLSWSMSTNLITEVNSTRQYVAARQVSPNFKTGVPHLLTLEGVVVVVVVVNIWRQLQDSDRTKLQENIITKLCTCVPHKSTSGSLRHPHTPLTQAATERTVKCKINNGSTV